MTSVGSYQATNDTIASVTLTNSGVFPIYLVPWRWAEVREGCVEHLSEACMLVLVRRQWVRDPFALRRDRNYWVHHTSEGGEEPVPLLH